MGYYSRNAGDPWSLTAPDDATLRFELRPGDVAPIDANNFTKNERSDVVFDSVLSVGVPAEVNFNLTVEAGPVNDASFLVLGQFYAQMADGTTATLPPLEIDLIDDQIVAYARYTDASGKIAAKPIFVSNALLTRGQSYNIDIKANFNPSGAGQAVLTIDGNVVANYSGPLGYIGQQSSSWAEGINRGAGTSQTFAADFSNTTITSNSAISFPDPVPYAAPPSFAMGQFSLVAGTSSDVSVPVAGYALGSTVVSIYSNGSLIGTTTAGTDGYYSTSVTLSGLGNHFLDASYTTKAGQVSVSSAPANFYIEDQSALSSVAPNILSLVMNGDIWWVQSAYKPWSISAPDANTLRFEVRDNDVAFYDKSTGTFSERSEIKDQAGIPNGTPLEVSYQFQIEPGAPNDAKWAIVGQLHPGDSLVTPVLVGPPFEIALVGEKMQINIVAVGDNGLPYVKTLYTDVSNIVRGHYYDIDIRAVFDPSGAGRLVVVRDGATLVDYTGSLGYPNQTAVYWREGIYRSSTGTVTMAADYSDLSIRSGPGVTITDAITAPSVTSSVVSGRVNGGTAAIVTFAGLTKANANITFSENDVVLGTAVANPDGSYAADVNLDLSIPHTISTWATDATGRSSIASVLVVDTAANVVANIDAIQAGSNLAAIVLTDSNILILPTQSVSSFSKNYASTLNKISGSYSFLKITAVTGLPYDTVKQYYTSGGVLYETDRLASSRLISSVVIAADGSQVSKSYSSSGVSITYIDRTGRTTEADLYTTTNILYSKTIYNADGSRVTYSFNQTTGVETGYTSVDSTGAKQIVTVNITGQAYSTQILTYNSAGKLLKQERLTTNGVEIYVVTYNSDGSNVTQQFSNAGVPTNTTIRYADGTYSIETFGILNQPYSAKTILYSASNKIIGTDTFDSAGTLLSSQRTNSDSSVTVFSVDISGQILGYTQTYPSGAKVIAIYWAGTRQVASITTFSASGAKTEVDVYDSSGAKLSSDVFASDGSDVLTTFDPASGLATGQTQTRADGSKVVTAYQPGSSAIVASVTTFSASGAKTEVDVYDPSGAKLSSDAFAPDGSDVLTTFDPASGLATGQTQTRADGSKVVTAYQPGSSLIRASVFNYGSSGVLTESEIFDTAGRLTEIDAFDQLGRRISQSQRFSDGTRVATTYDPASGAVLQSSTVFADGSHTDINNAIVGKPYTSQTISYSAAGKVVSMSRYYGDAAHTLAMTQVANADGSSEVHSYDTAGREISRTVTSADGTSEVVNSIYSGTSTTPSTVQDFHYAAGGKLLWSDVTNPNGSHNIAVATSGVSVSSNPGVSDTFLSASTGASTFVFQPAFGQDLVTNFHAGAGTNHDTLDLTAFHLSQNSGDSGAGVLAQMLRQSGNDVILTVSPTDTVTLKNTVLANLATADFKV